MRPAPPSEPAQSNMIVPGGMTRSSNWSFALGMSSVATIGFAKVPVISRRLSTALLSMSRVAQMSVVAPAPVEFTLSLVALAKFPMPTVT